MYRFANGAQRKFYLIRRWIFIANILAFILGIVIVLEVVL